MPSTDAAQAIAQAATKQSYITLSGGSITFDTSPNSQGTESTFATVQLDLPLQIDGTRAFGLVLPVYETFATNGDTSADTFTTTYDLVESPATPSNVVLYENGTRVQPDSVDYANDEITYTDQGSGEDLHVWYTSSVQNQMTVRKVSPDDAPQDLTTVNGALATQRDQNDQPFAINANLTPLHDALASNWSLEVTVDTAAQIRFEAQSGGETVRATNAILSVPVTRASTPIEGLGAAIRNDMGNV